MNILVTGGFGFVGGHLIDLLTEKYPESRIHVIDNLSTSPIPLETLLTELGERKNLTYEICSVRAFCENNSGVAWDQIYHLASVVGPAGILMHAGTIAWSILDDTRCLLDVAIDTKARFLDISTSEVYGGGKSGLCAEAYDKIIPAGSSARSEYAVGKLAAETMIINTGTMRDVDALIIRPFNISGPRQSGVGGFVLPRFIGLAVENMPLTVFGDGSAVRAFTHVRDVAAGIIACMDTGRSGEVYNIGNPANKVTINDLADMVIEVTGSSSTKEMVDPKTIYGPLYEEANDKYPDSEKAFAELGWKPQYAIREIIQETYEYMKQLDNDARHALSGVERKKR